MSPNPAEALGYQVLYTIHDSGCAIRSLPLTHRLLCSITSLLPTRALFGLSLSTVTLLVIGIPNAFQMISYPSCVEIELLA